MLVQLASICTSRLSLHFRNIGPWVGQPFRDALNAQFGNGKVAFQGVNPQDYAADLNGYVEDGGPEGCALSLAQAVQKYTARCPSAKIVISGWRLVLQTTLLFLPQ